MSKISLVYWSGTGNTELMANAVKDGIESAGKSVNFFEASEVKKEELLDSEILIFGSPACGSEQINEDYMEPLMEELKADLENKKVFLFGSFDWGGGEFMENWKAQLEEYKVNMIEEPVTAETTPDDDVLENLKTIGANIASL